MTNAPIAASELTNHNKTQSNDTSNSNNIIQKKSNLNPNAKVFKARSVNKDVGDMTISSTDQEADALSNKTKNKDKRNYKKNDKPTEPIQDPRRKYKGNKNNEPIQGSSNDLQGNNADKSKSRTKKQFKKLDGTTQPKRNKESSPETSQSSGVTKVSKKSNSSHKSRRSSKPKQKNIKDERDLRTKLTNALTDSSYECMVCWDNIRPKNSTWSCKSCWAVFHLSCVKKWAQVADSQNGEGNREVIWRCPGCQTTQNELPINYLCFCGRIQNPEVIKYNAPHSCGQSCGKSRGSGCPHPCVEPCHPGPCPPCAALAPTSYCFCGKLSYQTRCLDSEMDGKSCGEKCEELLGCGEHFCESTCHEGACPPCKIAIKQKCYCGNSEKEMFCGSGIGIDTYFLNQGSIESEPSLGYFSCSKPCERYLDCGNHKCNKSCHIQDEHPSHCPKDPNTQLTCPCGKVGISELIETPRKSCLDPIPLCGNICDKKLKACGHRCQSVCHEGDCPPCSAEVKAYCRCGSIHEIKACSENDSDLVCEKVCNQLKHCSKHRCLTVCCDASKKGSQDIDGLHICTTVCDKKLRCGNHRCQNLCHSGKCTPCLEASFDDLPCNCGKTKIQAPVPCGTKPPKCNFPCTRSRSCGHSTLLPHNCHQDDVECSPCTALTSKTCRCGKKELKHIPCFRQKPSCGTPCNKMLPCGGHACKKLCHEGPCIAEGSVCTSICNKPRPICGHPCQEICHAPSVCSSTTICNSKITVPCECGFIKKERVCNGQDVSSQKAKCTEKCNIEQRNKKLAEAFGLTNKGPIIDPTILYDPYIFIFITPTQLKWVKNMESKIEDFINDPDKPILRFAPMRDYQRKFLHVIAANYQVNSVSVDNPPFKSVEYTKTLNTRLPTVIPSVAYKNQDKYMKVEEEEENDISTIKQKQAVNCIIIKNLTIDQNLIYNLENNINDAGLKIDLFSYGYNAVVQPIHNLTDMNKAEELVRKTYYIAKSSLINSNIVAKINLGWVNSNKEVVWPKLDNITNNQLDNQPKFNSKNNFNFLKCDNLPTLPPNFLDLDVKSSNVSSRNASPSRSITSKEVEAGFVNNFDVASPSQIVDDWTELI